ncbi:hypothetical protein AVA65_08170 [Salmonella enterica subsp. enterica serovar Minnesota]|nr:hypothetical protein [Salmonella enterica subsp. enterica serovar Minnesota]
MDETIDNFVELEEAPIENEFAGEHAETIIDGMLDTIEGNESFAGGLTRSQQYLKSVMETNGHSFHNVHGTEGVIDTIKGGFKKAWEALKKALSAIWEWITTSRANRQAKEIFATVERERKSADDMAKDYDGEANHESMQSRLKWIEELETMLDTKGKEALAIANEVSGSILEINKPLADSLKKISNKVGDTYGMADAYKTLKRPGDVAHTLNQMKEVTRKIEAEQTDVRIIKSLIDGVISETEKKADEFFAKRSLKILKPVARILDMFVLCSQRKLNAVEKLVKTTKVEKMFTKKAAA